MVNVKMKRTQKLGKKDISLLITPFAIYFSIDIFENITQKKNNMRKIYLKDFGDDDEFKVRVIDLT